MMLLKTLVCCALVVLASAVGTLRDECAQSYADEYVTAASRDDRCAALHTLAMCFFNGLTSKEDMLVAQGFLDAAQFNEDCSDYAPTIDDEVQLESTESSLLFTMGREKEIKLRREQLPEVVSIWDVSNKVSNLETMAAAKTDYNTVVNSVNTIKVSQNQAFAKVKTDLLAWVDSRISATSSKILTTFSQAIQSIQASADSVTDAVDARISGYSTSLSATKARIISSVVNTTTAMNKISLSNLTTVFNLTKSVEDRLNTLNASVDTRINNAFGANTKTNANNLIASISLSPMMNFQIPVFRTMQFSTYGQNQGWYCGNAAHMFGGVNPSSWTDGNALAYSMSSDKNVLRTLFTRKQYGGHNALVSAHEWYSYSSTNGEVTSALFRIRNKSSSPVVWRTYFYYSCYGGWNEYASVALNGNNQWSDGGNAGGSSSVNVDLTIPAGRVSTAIFNSMSSPQSGTRANVLIFYNDCLRLPSGLEYADDLDYAVGGWEA